MKNKKKTVSDSNVNESVDDPSPVPLVESTRLDDKSVTKTGQWSNQTGNEEVSSDSINDNTDLGTNSANKLVKKKKKNLTQVNVGAENAGLGNDTADTQATFNAKDLSQDDEVYIFHCPSSFKKHDLLNKIINISKSKQFIQDKKGENFQLKILNLENRQVTLAVPEEASGGKLFNLPLKGHMILQKVVEMDSSLVNDLDDVEDAVVFPNDIKIRHPFLGVDWKSYIDSARKAIGKNQFMKKRKETKKEKISEDVNVENRKKKRKSSYEITSPKKKKHENFNI